MERRLHEKYSIFPQKHFGLYMKSVNPFAECATVVQQGHLRLKRISANAFINTLINESFAHNIFFTFKNTFSFQYDLEFVTFLRGVLSIGSGEEQLSWHR